MGQAPTAVARCRVEVAVTRVDRRARKLHYESHRAKRRGNSQYRIRDAVRATRGVGITSLGFTPQTNVCHKQNQRGKPDMKPTKTNRRQGAPGAAPAQPSKARA
jgi:hypothetical protein